jgi:hypothetical protein
MLATPFEHPNQEPIVERRVVQNNDTGRRIFRTAAGVTGTASA